MRLALAIALLLALPATASASKVSVVLADGCNGDVACSKYGGAPPVPVTTFEGAAGEANLVGVRREGGEFVVRDDGALLTAESPCVLDRRAQRARCPVTEGSGGMHGFAAALGDGDDRMIIAGDLGVETSISGGDGKDVVEGGAENDSIDGGAGGDRLLGGGGGLDELSYATRTAPVVVDLARETGGEAGEDDGVAGFEILIGGGGDDVLSRRRRHGQDRRRRRRRRPARARRRRRALRRHRRRPAVGPGRRRPPLRRPRRRATTTTRRSSACCADRLDGGRGNDALYDTGGRNTYLGGPGRGRPRGRQRPRPHGRRLRPRTCVVARGGGRDRVRCGAGRDQAATDRRDTRRSCERRAASPIPTGDQG